ncbi:MAG TPA: YlxR family protein [Candidatus Sulfomarinibacteraceae bacterium]|nr:YlxR family protein [Candidatus Sulfomarinibacteraceae bacterium]
MACRTPRDKRELVRVVRTPDGAIRADATGRAPGRGAYVCHDPACIANAIARGALARALETRVPAGLHEELTATITLDSIGGGARGQE